MNNRQRHKLKYLLHLLDDDDIDEAFIPLSGRRERRRAPRPRYRMPFRLTPRLMMILTASMAVVSVVSWLAAGVAPYALFVIPMFFVYCAVIVIIRARLQKVYYVGG